MSGCDVFEYLQKPPGGLLYGEYDMETPEGRSSYFSSALGSETLQKFLDGTLNEDDIDDIEDIEEQLSSGHVDEPLDFVGVALPPPDDRVVLYWAHDRVRQILEEDPVCSVSAAQGLRCDECRDCRHTAEDPDGDPLTFEETRKLFLDHYYHYKLGKYEVIGCYVPSKNNGGGTVALKDFSGPES